MPVVLKPFNTASRRFCVDQEVAKDELDYDVMAHYVANGFLGDKVEEIVDAAPAAEVVAAEAAPAA